MNASEHDPSIDNEPHRQAKFYSPDPSEDHAARTIGDALDQQSPDGQIEHSVWDEPGLSPVLTGPLPDEALTYDRWLQWRISETSAARSWSTTVLLALVAGPWAVLGAMFTGGNGATGIIALTVFGPLAEEVMKCAAVLWTVEKRPFLFQSPLQIGICALCSGLCFAAIENLLYLTVYVPEPSTALVLWRWTVCVALHMGCTLITGLGLMRIWRQTMTHFTRPALSLAAPYLTTAVVIHGVYNALAVVMEFTLFQF